MRKERGGNHGALLSVRHLLKCKGMNGFPALTAFFFFPPRTRSRASRTNKTACALMPARWFWVALRLVPELKARGHIGENKTVCSEIKCNICIEPYSKWIQMHQFFRIIGESKENYIQGDKAAASSRTTYGAEMQLWSFWPSVPKSQMWQVES